ncbi:alpha-ketoglutarate-dependent dioxygenase alkB homolog 3-like [Saccoglossus kowalevskii]|uniref:Alpha-ketoglutarate-dependent dioxygenase alkB homolog 3-like n=1 Tax=Saccoglossus kowalevskii TaxID=10224 RepID=A0ABM0M593_SACKO|nr:PREDICTED: alpha-ketoglutarate-dependent dioxygenase alkB homolog 3-like [Saccoglossus kowalevskii]
MSSEKRRRARVQGSWAPPPRKPQEKKEASRAMPEVGVSSPVRKPQPPQFAYVESGQAIRTPPPVIRIESASDETIISDGPTGKSILRYYPQFIEEKELQRIFQTLCKELPWKQRFDVKRDGTSYKQPRMTAWYGDLSYAYSGVVLPPSESWHPLVLQLRERIEKKPKYTFNSVLGNLYRNEYDSVDWHSDDEAGLRDFPIIASLTFGDMRIFKMRKKPPLEEKGDYTYQQHIEVPLPSGSLLIMEGATQADWQHSIPKSYHSKGPRVNLTYRTIYPVEEI